MLPARGRLLKGKCVSLPDLRNQPYIRTDTGRRSARRRPPGPPLQVTSDLSLGVGRWTGSRKVVLSSAGRAVPPSLWTASNGLVHPPPATEGSITRSSPQMLLAALIPKPPPNSHT
ncbi:hypothetical protein P7K49_010718 [Saguinus oedipus]|uniref:Uncharacterized protein n=1 Tax=Saguinus oedipus TaxID=9490 RepID=A0ABQ9VNK3_SAGOE|nr:hypothetical protein P7K49_010718 [Saguinus oedipus]